MAEMRMSESERVEQKNGRPPLHRSESESDLTTPFSYHYSVTPKDWLIMGLMIPIFPIRLLLITLSCLIAWAAGKVALFGLPIEEVNATPFVGWRRGVRFLILALARIMFFSLGIQRIRVEGKYEESSVAPVLITVPHISYLDAMLSAVFDITPVIKAEFALVPIIGVYLRALQPVWVDRELAESREGTKTALVKRCKEQKGLWPPVMVFAEGTTSNGRSLYKFKPGAFYPGEPVQIAVIHYESCVSFDPLVMAWDGEPPFKSMCYTMLQPHITAVVRLLPVYYPSEEERHNPVVYARNVQEIVAKYLRVPATQYTYIDAKKYLSQIASVRSADTEHLHSQ